VAGRIRDADVATVRERSSIELIVSDHVQLRPAGGGSLRGLCPFHDEKTPSFNVRPQVGLYHCFGCGAGGDVISFVREIDGLSFQEAVERLARRAGVTLTYEGASAGSRELVSQRQRLVDAHRAAAEFYAEQLASPAARGGREFLAARGFDAEAAGRFGVGYAPGAWDALARHLLGRRFSGEELITGGLAKQGARGGLVDRFRDRLIWPIKDLSGDVVGFGGRRLGGEDAGPKYLNTPETPLFKKANLLYGAEAARREIARRREVVVVEGYTDVMACHLAGVPTAVAACGTAFGSEHVAVVRRLLMDSDSQRGQVIFTFDGDAAGQKAALRAFDFEERFVTQTFVAVEPTGQDPCELRISRGDAAVRDLIARRVPLVEFAVRRTITDYDLDTTEGRLAALDAAAPLVNRIKDRGRRQRYAVELDRWLGFLDEKFVVNRVAEARIAAQRAAERTAERAGGGAPDRKGSPDRDGRSDRTGPPERAGSAGPAPRAPTPIRAAGGRDDAAEKVEREVLKVVLQYPGLAGPMFDMLPAEVFTRPEHRAVQTAVAAVGGAGAGLSAAGDVPSWVAAVTAAAAENVRRSVMALAVEEIHCDRDVDDRYVEIQLARIQELHVARRIAELKSRVQRLNAAADTEAFARTFNELIRLEQSQRQLRERGVGAA
jgi:DNA primase